MIGGGILAPAGFRGAATRVGMRIADGDDLALIVADGPATAAATFTTSRFRAAPVDISAATVATGAAVRGIVVNAGCANCGTGSGGVDDARRMVAAAARRVGCPESEMLVASTGLIGSRLDIAGIEAGLAGIHPERGARVAESVARAIMTTDTRPKQAAARVTLPSGAALTVGGTAKGSGMIHPQMATMLAFLTTDAAIDAVGLQTLLRDVVERTFNQVTVDGDGSTNDSVMLLAAGLVTLDGPDDRAAFAAALEAVARSLAQQIAADGEGATRRIDVTVTGAEDNRAARRAARTVAGSQLVKAAVHGADPNWGRIAAAIGRAEVAIDPWSLRIWIGDELTFAGDPVAFDEEAASRVLRGATVLLRVDLGVGDASGEAWGCDLSAEYVVINSEYST